MLRIATACTFLGENGHKSLKIFFIIRVHFYFISLIYANIENTMVKLILNNLLLIIFGYLFYILEFENLKKIKHLDA